jgi:hypothetical protein
MTYDKSITSIHEANEFFKSVILIKIDNSVGNDNVYLFNFDVKSIPYIQTLRRYFYTDNGCVRYFSESEIIIAANEIRRMFNLKAFL